MVMYKSGKGGEETKALTPSKAGCEERGLGIILWTDRGGVHALIAESTSNQLVLPAGPTKGVCIRGQEEEEQEGCLGFSSLDN